MVVIFYLSTILINIVLNFIFCVKDYKKLYNKINELEIKEKEDINNNNDDNNKMDKISQIITENDKEHNFISLKKSKKLRKNNKEINKNKFKSYVIKNNKYSPVNKKVSKIFINLLNKKKISDCELNNLPYTKSLKIDNRTFYNIFLSLLKTNHTLLFTFFNSDDYNSKSIKIFLFFFSFEVSLTVNALFYNDETMNKIYEDKGNFDFIYQIPQILYSSLITIALNLISTYLSLTENNIISIKQEKIIKNLNIKAQNKYCFIKAKFSIFCFIIFFILLIFCYYITCFCCIYSNTQIHLIKDSGISFLLPLIYPFFICLIPGLFRTPALNDKKKKRKYLYEFSKLIQTFS